MQIKYQNRSKKNNKSQKKIIMKMKINQLPMGFLHNLLTNMKKMKKMKKKNQIKVKQVISIIFNIQMI